MKTSAVDPTVPTAPVEPPYAVQSSVLGWLGAELWDHLWPWTREGFAHHRTVQAAGLSLALAASVAWVLAAAGQLQSSAIIAWWFGWSVYEVIVRLGSKCYVKDGPWWGRRYRRASVMDMICYVGFKNLLIGATLFLTLKSLGWLLDSRLDMSYLTRVTSSFCTAFMLMLGQVCLVCGAMAATVTVHPGQSIQLAIDGAVAGDVIEIERGRYNGHVLVNKTLTLRGINRPTLSAQQSGDTIRVVATDVVIEGLIVRDSGDSLIDQNAGIYIRPGSHRTVVRHCDLTYNLFGLWIEKANDVRIENNVITGKRDYGSSQRGNGIQLYNTNGANIVGNNIGFVRDALYIDVSHHAVFRQNKLHHSRYGTHYMNSYYNVWEDNDTWMNRGGLALMEVRNQVVRNNRAWANSDHGIMLRSIQDSVIENNVVAGNARGFFIYDVEYTSLKNNLVVDNTVGVHLAAGSTRNQVEGNDFISNREQVRYVGARDEPWGTEHGNHWSNYLGWDRNGDGKGDVPYEANDMVDRLTWRYPMVKMLLSSPAVQALRLVGQQFPVLRVPSVIDPNPRMLPAHANWRQWLGKHDTSGE